MSFEMQRLGSSFRGFYLVLLHSRSGHMKSISFVLELGSPELSSSFCLYWSLRSLFVLVKLEKGFIGEMGS